MSAASETNELLEQEEEEIFNLASSEFEDVEVKEKVPEYGARFEPGDLVWVSESYEAESRKVYTPWRGPYIKIRRTDEVYYQIRRPGALETWRNFHYTFLKPYLGKIPSETGKKRLTTSPLEIMRNLPMASDSPDQ